MNPLEKKWIARINLKCYIIEKLIHFGKGKNA